MTQDTVLIRCCEPMMQAQTSGTDNEGYGRLIWAEPGCVNMGCGLPNIKYCPWCGKEIDL